MYSLLGDHLHCHCTSCVVLPLYSIVNDQTYICFAYDILLILCMIVIVFIMFLNVGPMLLLSHGLYDALCYQHRCRYRCCTCVIFIVRCFSFKILSSFSSLCFKLIIASMRLVVYRLGHHDLPEVLLPPCCSSSSSLAFIVFVDAIRGVSISIKNTFDDLSNHSIIIVRFTGLISHFFDVHYRPCILVDFLYALFSGTQRH